MKIADAHCDTIVKLLENGENLTKNSGPIDLQKLQVYDHALLFFAIWLSNDKLNEPFRHAKEAILFFHEQSVNFNEKVSAVLALEGGEALEGKMENLYAFYDMGVRCITLTWNRQNELGDGVGVQNPRGLSPFGRDVISEMERLGMLVDVSHIAQPGFWDVAKTATKPFIASHSNCYHLCPHPRNLTDDQIKAVAEKNGVIGVNLYPPFLQKDKLATVETVIAHINHTMKIGGEFCVCLGTDFDGMDITLPGLEDIRQLQILWELLAKQHGSRITENIFYKNLTSLVN